MSNKNPTYRFPKGTSGNPKGRKRLSGAELDVKLLAKVHTKEAVDRLASLMRDEEAGGKVNVAAAVALLDRGHGRPTQAVEHSGGVELTKRIILMDEARVDADA